MKAGELGDDAPQRLSNKGGDDERSTGRQRRRWAVEHTLMPTPSDVTPRQAIGALAS
jgi:hypothetical protein